MSSGDARASLHSQSTAKEGSAHRAPRETACQGFSTGRKVLLPATGGYNVNEVKASPRSSPQHSPVPLEVPMPQAVLLLRLLHDLQDCGSR